MRLPLEALRFESHILAVAVAHVLPHFSSVHSHKRNMIVGNIGLHFGRWWILLTILCWLQGVWQGAELQFSGQWPAKFSLTIHATKTTSWPPSPAWSCAWPWTWGQQSLKVINRGYRVHLGHRSLRALSVIFFTCKCHDWQWQLAWTFDQLMLL